MANKPPLNCELPFAKYNRKFGRAPQPLRTCTPKLFAKTNVTTGAKKNGDGNWTSVRINDNSLFSFGSIANPLIACGPPSAYRDDESASRRSVYVRFQDPAEIKNAPLMSEALAGAIDEFLGDAAPEHPVKPLFTPRYAKEDDPDSGVVGFAFPMLYNKNDVTRPTKDGGQESIVQIIKLRSNPDGSPMFVTEGPRRGQRAMTVRPGVMEDIDADSRIIFNGRLSGYNEAVTRSGPVRGQKIWAYSVYIVEEEKADMGDPLFGVDAMTPEMRAQSEAALARADRAKSEAAKAAEEALRSAREAAAGGVRGALDQDGDEAKGASGGEEDGDDASEAGSWASGGSPPASEQGESVGDEEREEVSAFPPPSPPPARRPTPKRRRAQEDAEGGGAARTARRRRRA